MSGGKRVKEALQRLDVAELSHRPPLPHTKVQKETRIEATEGLELVGIERNRQRHRTARRTADEARSLTSPSKFTPQLGEAAKFRLIGADSTKDNRAGNRPCDVQHARLAENLIVNWESRST